VAHVISLLVTEAATEARVDGVAVAESAGVEVEVLQG